MKGAFTTAFQPIFKPAGYRRILSNAGAGSPEGLCT